MRGSRDRADAVRDVRLKPEGARLFDEYAAAHQGERFAIVIDGIVQSVPSINAPRFNGQAQISGSYSADDINHLVVVLLFGPLPLEIGEVRFGAVSCADIGL